MNLAQMIERNVRRIPHWSAVLSETRNYTWEEYNRQVNMMGNALRKQGVSKGDRVAICLPNSPEYLVTYFAIVKLGAIAVPFNIMFKSSEVCYIVNNSEPKVMVALAGETMNGLMKMREKIPSIEKIILVGEHELDNVLSYPQIMQEESDELELVDCAPDEVVTILYTSGTTGQPKGAMLTHNNFYKMAELNSCYVDLITDQDISFTGTPFCHIFFVTTVLGPMYKGAAVVTAPRFFPEKALELISKFKVTHFAAVPTMYIYMLETYLKDPQRYNLRAWRNAQSAGAAMPAEYIAKIEDSFRVNFCENYGATETGSTAAYGRLGHGKAGSIGLPSDNWEVIVGDQNNQSVPQGEVGEIVLKGPGLFKGYWKMPEATEEALVDGWFHTGDLARVDEDGYIYVVDRKKHMLICGGYNIYPREVEEVLYAHPAVLEAAVIGIPHPSKGEIPKAFITLKSDCQAIEAEIIAFCKERMAAYKAPRVVEFLTEFPKNYSGKIMKKELLNRYVNM
ncbi:long-chain acyl-CoA synthetase [Desulfosporosinus lacus DSM 15449]|uniref:Long-chain acyl-CoA synthetase n=1 Tax=Desulfosporosinus lacus DSM 15449 TaxID=1121420 RepID=A0A1M5Z6F7_9FIRM|nr:long-chain acyl-CoA synthetase [Desulfosporosinus lacus DSM 15449]